MFFGGHELAGECRGTVAEAGEPLALHFSSACLKTPELNASPSLHRGQAGNPNGGICP